ncbi:hypothetical protein BDA99DRAFT_430943 [Phascolomyces articulosus]|uniref:Cyclase n=1 Tax=Phascolomyces articulosus TaxID=60185 RepID=A0AAD5PIW0_9FUNG|nr:hypothetical protein BDA99DRAFT_430943 [Phascolomyces articulosus]
MTKFPLYDDLPIDPKYPPKTAWGVWGTEDNFGTLNHLTEERVLKASQCIRRGALFPLNWRLESPTPHFFERPRIDHRVEPCTVMSDKLFDEVYHNFNTQSSSQWDGLRHSCHWKTGTFYNNVPRKEIVPGPESTDRLSMHYVAERGIAGRALLLDYGLWRERNGGNFDPLVRYEIPVHELEQVARDQHVEFQEGDILLLRTGFIAACTILSAENKIHLHQPSPESAGIKACEETYRWVWNNRFAAIASDNVSVEASPYTSDVDTCHSQFLGGFGLPMGELFNLDPLAEDSAKDGVYEYFFTSAPLNKYQGLATPPNAICIK